MGRIIRSDSNLYDRPTGSFLVGKGYVYINTSNKYISSNMKKEKGTKGYTGHDSVCIGVAQDPSDKNNKKFYANRYYLERQEAKELPEPPEYADSLAVGLNSWIAAAAAQWHLNDDLAEVFGEEDAQQILDLAHYMLSAESAVMQHYPAWAREHVLFSEDIKSDTTIGRFLKKNLSVSKIALFREKWAVRNIGDGRIYLCYDSTNVNSQAEGVFIVQKGMAKDDKTLDQVNTDYVIRQADGLPLTYLHSPGSVSDIAQAQEMIAFIKRVKELTGKDIILCLICDRGYISEKNLRQMDGAGFTYILMLRSNFGLYDRMADEAIDMIKSYKYELNSDDDELYGMTKPCTIYEGGPQCYAQIIWSNERYQSKRNEVKTAIAKERGRLEDFIESNKGKALRAEELKWVPSYFKLQLEAGEPLREEKKKRGRGNKTETVEIPTFRISGYEDDETEINRLYQKAGIMIIMTREELTAQETIDAYAKRDCVEKVFEALKSHLGMDKIGVTTEEAMHGKGVVWFVASILHAILFNQTAKLRTISRKSYTVPAMVDQLEAIKADRNLSAGKRQRRYKITNRQSNILNCFGINEAKIDSQIAEMDF